MRIAVLGAGRMGAFHAATLAGEERVGGLMVVDADEARAAAVAGPLRATSAARLADALAAGADAVVVATPTATHAEVVTECLDAGVAIFCEKPLALDLTETRKVVEAAEGADAVLMMGFQRRFDTGHARLRRLIADGQVGTVYSFRMAGYDAAPPPPGYVEHSGGMLADLHIHDFDTVRWLLDDEVESVYATGSVRVSETFAEHDDIDCVALCLRMRSGVVGVVTGGRHNPAGYDVRVEVFGSRDSLTAGVGPRSPLRSVEPEAPEREGPAFADFLDRFAPAYRAELGTFLDVAAQAVPSPCTGRDAYEALRIAVAADRSRRAGRPVALEEVA